MDDFILKTRFGTSYPYHSIRSINCAHVLSSSGKSTQGHCLNGLVCFSHKGEVSGSENQRREHKEFRYFSLSKKVGTVLQDQDGQFIGLSVAEDIAFALENDCVPQTQMFAKVAEVSQMRRYGGLFGLLAAPAFRGSEVYGLHGTS